MRIATRSSPLALWQARAVAHALEASGALRSAAELVPVTTSGDTDASTPISEMSGRGVFVTEVQAAVLDGRADLAVHSAKDMRSEPTDGLTLAGCLPRGEVRDALIGLPLDAIPHGGVVATGSQRRQCQLAHLRRDLRFVGLRGNMARRIATADGPDVDAVVVAAVALERLDEVHRIAQWFSDDEMLPQVGQGAIAIEHRVGDSTSAAAMAAIIDAVTTRCVDAERAFLRTLGGGCDLPTGAYATLDDTGTLEMSALLASPDGTDILRAAGRGTDPNALGIALAQQLLAESASLTCTAEDV